MNKESSMLVKTANKLGVVGPAVKKAEEFLRTFQAKGSVKVKNLSDVAKNILCLDLATTHMSARFDKETAIKLSGLKKPAYQLSLHTVEKILDLDKPLTVSELCVQLSCTVIKELAEEIFEKYKSNNRLSEHIDHPQYIAAAVYTACKLKKVKIQKPQIVEISRLKPQQWKELTIEFEKFALSFGIGSVRKSKISDPKSTLDVDELAKDIERKVVLKKNQFDEEQIEDYETWKKRILDEAYEALKTNYNDNL
ncbi:unnamed protein product [Phaedon cochleariae]|uniref:Origin recognition complex subunit 6 n=1 Tax=Phaedon cochleariae TaxID=80249 RepID=A0A9N9SKX0_PHACE|nr:unnamed protein product [Phaedon cochleariae]